MYMQLSRKLLQHNDTNLFNGTWYFSLGNIEGLLAIFPYPTASPTIANPLSPETEKCYLVLCLINWWVWHITRTFSYTYITKVWTTNNGRVQKSGCTKFFIVAVFLGWFSLLFLYLLYNVILFIVSKIFNYSFFFIYFFAVPRHETMTLEQIQVTWWKRRLNFLCDLIILRLKGFRFEFYHV